jgi:hypothetical protein
VGKGEASGLGWKDVSCHPRETFFGAGDLINFKRKPASLDFCRW